jgi:hypothetical protein
MRPFEPEDDLRTVGQHKKHFLFEAFANLLVLERHRFTAEVNRFSEADALDQRGIAVFSSGTFGFGSLNESGYKDNGGDQ